MRTWTLRFAVVFTLLFCFVPGPVSVAQRNGRILIGQTPRFVSTANDLGSEELSKPVTIHVWLQMHNVESLRELVRQQHDPTSGHYHSWLTREEFSARYGPTAEEAATVQKFLSAHNLNVVSVGERNLYVKAEGSVADVQKAFQTQIRRFNVRGETYRSNTTDPVLERSIAPLVSRVSGLTDYGYKPHLARPLNPETGQPFPAVSLSATPHGAFFAANCFRPPQTVSLSTDGALPKAFYSGNRYGSDITSPEPNLPPCGYQPSEVQTAYGLNGVYAAGLDGTGQTVVIVDAYGSPTIGTDASVFSGFYGLAPLNLTIYQPGGTPGFNSGWAGETTLDVEWSHSVAPGANIALVEAPSSSFGDLDAAIAFAVENGLGNVISNSYGTEEANLGGSPFTPLDDLLLFAGSLGISVNYSSGDSGDFAAIERFTDVSYPASSIYATAVGGTSLALKADNTMLFQTGWGNNETRVANVTDAKGYNTPVNPPLHLGFVYGAGGGTSAVYTKPAFQNSLPGSFRKVPDISYLADPYTGVEVICNTGSCSGSGNSLNVYVIGGTSLACPMFSAMWAIVNEKVGVPLGQAAQSLYSLPAGAITDVVPPSPAFNVFGFIASAGGRTTAETASQLAQPLGSATPFFSALYNGTSTRWYVLTFGTDSSLFTAPGWDNVTGLGTPNGLPFVNAF
ncbi:MAG TPA: S53 family peptidase [Terriglobia bacterium]|nr:S53 family peptidase [Terriglobia bacterium]